MAGLKKSARDLISEVEEGIRSELLESLRPSIRKLVDAAAELEAALDAGGRRAGAGKRSAAAAAKPRGKKGKRRGKRAPRGALQQAIRDTLASSASPLKFSEINNRILETAPFKGRSSKSLYTQIVNAVSKMPDVKKGADGRYRLQSAARK